MAWGFAAWVFSWVMGRKKKDVEHIRLSVGKGAATIVLFFAFFAVMHIQTGYVSVGVVLDIDELDMYNSGDNCYIQFAGTGETAEDEIISLQVTKDQYQEIASYKDTMLIQYTYNPRLPVDYHFISAKSKETMRL